MKFFIILLTSIISIQHHISYASFYSIGDDFYDVRPDPYYISNVDINIITNIQELDDLQIEYHQKLTNLTEELKKLNEMPVNHKTDEQYRLKSLKVRKELFNTIQIIDWLLARQENLERLQYMLSNKINEFNKKNN